MDNNEKSLFYNVLRKDLASIKSILQEKNQEITKLAVQSISIPDLSPVLRNRKDFETMLSYSISVTTPFHISSALGLVDIFELFIVRGVPIDVATEEGIMASHLASLFGQKKIIKITIEKYGGNISIPDQYGWSCLHFACIKGAKDVAQLLLDAGIDPMARDKDGTTAAYRAKEAGFNEIVDLIRLYKDSDRLLSIKEEDGDTYDYIDVETVKKEDLGEDGYLVPNTLRLQSHGIPRPQIKRSGNESPDYTSSLPLDDTEEISDGTVITSLREAAKPKSKPVKLPLPARRSSSNLMDTIRYELQIYYGGQKSVELSKSPAPSNLDEYGDDEDHYCSISEFDDEEDPYSTIAEVIAAAHKKNVPDPPTVRGRLPASKLRPSLPEQIRSNVNSISIIEDMPGSEALKRACLFVSIRLQDKWKSLAKVLELPDHEIQEIAGSYHYDGTQQCAVALKRWQTNKRRDVDDLVIALKKSDFESIVVDVQQVVSEFSA